MKKISTIVIAAAGRGTRMNELSVDQPKHLIEVSGRPFIDYLLDIVEGVGFERVIVVVGYQGDQLKSFLKKRSGDHIVVDQQEQVGEKYGTAAVVEAAAVAVGDNPFVFINGDALKTPDALEVVRANDGLAHIVGTNHPEPQHYGVLSVDEDGYLKEVIEKPVEPPSDLINIGIYSFPADVFSMVKDLDLSPRGEYELTDAVNQFAQDRKVLVHELEGDWVDMGKPEDVPQVEDWLSRHNLV